MAAAQFKKATEGTFDDIRGVTVAVEESSHGVSGYLVNIEFTGKQAPISFSRKTRCGEHQPAYLKPKPAPSKLWLGILGRGVYSDGR